MQGMLRNIDSVPLERIHKMLQLFVMHDANVQVGLMYLLYIFSQCIACIYFIQCLFRNRRFLVSGGQLSFYGYFWICK